MYIVYCIQCNDGSIYTGITTDIARRLAQHNAGRGGHYTRSRGVRKLLYAEKRRTRSSALKRELEIKSWSRSEKLDFIRSKIVV